MRYIGIDIGGTKCAVVLGDENCTILKKVSFPTTSFEETFSRLILETEKMGTCNAIGISCGGPLNSKEGVIISPPNLPDWRNIEIVKILRNKFGVPVLLKNDADACALAEWQFGAGKGSENMIFLTFGTGLGAGLILNGKLYSGTCDTAGEVGHIRMTESGPVGHGKAGSFEGYCSGGGISRMGEAFAKEKNVNFYDEDGKITAKSIAVAAENGDNDAIAIYTKCGQMLGKGLSILVDILNPEKIVIGSIYQRSGHLMANEMKKEMKKECIGQALSACEVVPAELGDNIGDVAAVCVANYTAFGIKKHLRWLRNSALFCSFEMWKAKQITK